MHDQSDAQLLRAYAERGAEAAFAEIVARHTDLVYSAALRQVYSPDLARDVTQSVFTDLARKAREVSFKLSPEASLVGWLYRGTRFAARDLHRNETRRTQRERQAMEQLHPTPETPPDWEQLRPILDDAMSELDDTDRDAVLLRYFKNHDLRTVGATLGISDDAAQKRVSRAVERLREFFAKRGVTVGASGLAVVISANAVQAAPVGLALTISTAAVLTGTAFATAATVTATKAIAMTALQKTIVTATIAVLAGAGIYEAIQASYLREQVQLLEQYQSALAQQIVQLEAGNEQTTRQLATMQNENAQLPQSKSQLAKLRAEATRLWMNETTMNVAVASHDDPAWVTILQQAEGELWREGLRLVMKQRLNLTPQQTSRLDDIFERIKTDGGLELAPADEAELKGLLTPEQVKSYEEMTSYRIPGGIRVTGHYAALARASSEVSVLERQLGLTAEQQSKAVSLLTTAFNDEPASLPNNSPEERHIMRKAEALKGVLTEEQFAIYQRYADQMLGVARLQATEKH